MDIVYISWKRRTIVEMSHVFVSFTLHFVCLSLPITTEDSAAEASSGCGQCKTWCIVLRVESSTRVMLWVLSVIISMKLRQGGISSVNWLDFLCDFYPAPAQVACAPLSTHNRHSDIYIALLRPNKLEMLIDLGRGRGISAQILNVLMYCPMFWWLHTFSDSHSLSSSEAPPNHISA